MYIHTFLYFKVVVYCSRSDLIKSDFILFYISYNLKDLA